MKLKHKLISIQQILKSIQSFLTIYIFHELCEYPLITFFCSYYWYYVFAFAFQFFYWVHVVCIFSALDSQHFLNHQLIFLSLGKFSVIISSSINSDSLFFLLLIVKQQAFRLNLFTIFQIYLQYFCIFQILSLNYKLYIFHWHHLVYKLSLQFCLVS